MNNKHWVVVFDWAIENGELASGLDIVAVKHTLEEAKKVLAESAIEEKRYANEHGYIIHADNDMEFDAGEAGYYSAEHAHYYIVEVE